MTIPALRAAPSDFESLYARFGATIYARCRQILGDAAAAEDATQEVFVRVHHHLGRMNGQRQAVAWLYRAATNHCLNEVRNGRTRARLVGSVPPVPEPDAERRISERDFLLRLVRELPEELALAAWLFHVDGMEQAEIAEVCGVSRRTVISRLGRFAERARVFMERSEG